MSESQVLKEYLLAIGFSVNETETRKFDKELKKLDKGADFLAKGLFAVGTAAAGMVTAFSRSMEQLYYSSKRADSTVGNIQQLEYAGQQIGLAGGKMQASLEGMARALRSNPGLQGLLESLGVQVTGRDKADVLTDFVTQLKGMPFYIAQQYGEMFGINPDDLLLIQQELDTFKALRAERAAMAKEMGVNADEAAAAAKDYMNSWRQITAQAGLFKDVVAIEMLPAMKALSEMTSDTLKSWTKIVQRETPGSFLTKLGEGLASMAGINMAGTGGVKLTAEARARLAGMGLKPGQNPGAVGGTQSGSGMSPIEPSMFDRLEAQYGLPAGFLDRMWKKESNRGRAMLSPKGAQGHFGFMPGTAKEMGLSDPNNLEESAGAAAAYMAKLLKKYGGDLQSATAAYNWGMGNVDRQGLSKAPWETRDYVQSLTGQPITVEQTNHFYTNGTGDAGAVDGISRSLDNANSNLVRNLSGAIR